MQGFGFRKQDDNPHLRVVPVRFGGVEHLAISRDGKKPFIPPMKECHSIELLQDDVVVDIGAYVGTYSKWCAEAGVRKVVAYEPTPFTCSVLRKNLEAYSFCEVVEAAVVGDSFQDDMVKLRVSDGIGITNGLVGKKHGQTDIEVEAIKFSTAVQTATVVKIDVEGAEYDYSFASLPSFVRAVIIDFHPLETNWIRKAQSIVDLLHESGFADVVTPDWSNGWTRAGSWIRRRNKSQEK